jgi:hypothetical protein
MVELFIANIPIYTKEEISMNTLIPSKQSPRAAKAIAALEKNHFHAAYFPTAQAAIDELCRLIPHTASVGLGGSQTLEQLAIRERLTALGNIVYCHNKPGLTPEEILSIRRQQLTCDIFFDQQQRHNGRRKISQYRCHWKSRCCYDFWAQKGYCNRRDQ